MSSPHDKATVRAYEEQERSSLAHYRVLFHAYNFCRYAGMLRSLFLALGKSNVSAEQIQENDAFKCAALAAENLSRLLEQNMTENRSAYLDLCYSTETAIHAFRSAQGTADASVVPDLLHLAAIFLYQQLLRSLPDDVCTYRQIDPDDNLMNFAAERHPAIDLRPDYRTKACRQLALVLRALTEKVR